MKYLLAFAILAFFTGCGMSSNIVGGGSLKAGAPLMPDGDWKLTFDDEFNGSSLDTTAWTADAEVTCSSQATCLASRWPENVSVSGGYLHLITKQEERMEGRPYTTGGIRSAFTQQYGYVEARIRYANASGMNNAIWLFTPDKYPILLRSM